jgi:hypothetical protein
MRLEGGEKGRQSFGLNTILPESDAAATLQVQAVAFAVTPVLTNTKSQPLFSRLILCQPGPAFAALLKGSENEPFQLPEVTLSDAWVPVEKLQKRNPSHAVFFGSSTL